MKKTLIGMAILFSLVTVSAVKAEDDSKQIMANQAEYLTMRAESIKLFEAKEYVKYSELMLKIADCAHAKRFNGVHAWSLNNSGFGYILAGDFCKAKAILEEAVKIDYDNADWKEKVEKNLNCATVNCKGEAKK